MSQDVIEQLVDPDSETKGQYLWDDDFQRLVLGMMLSDRYFLVQSFGLIKPSYFKNEIHQVCARLVLDYFEKQKQLPSKIYLKQIVGEKLRDKYTETTSYEAIKLLYTSEITTVYDYFSKGGIGEMMPCLDSPEAILAKVVSFAKTQAMKMCFLKSYEAIKKDPLSDSTWDKVDSYYKEARLVDRKVDLGLNYFTSVEERYIRMAEKVENEEVFTTGFESIDQGLAGRGLVRGEIGAYMAKPGVGKSICLVVASVKNIAKGKKVLYISTEMDQDRIATRFDAQFSQIGQHELLPRKEEVWASLSDCVSSYENKQRLVIKQFPSGTADMSIVRAYHSQLVMLGFRPDLLILDYPGDMKDIPGVASWENRWRLVRDLRGFGVEENHCTMIAIQPNKSASDLTIEQVMDESNQGDSYNQNRVLDAFWTINQTDKERLASVGRINVAKARNGKSRYWFKVMFDYQNQTLSVYEISDERYACAMRSVQEQKSEKVGKDFEDNHTLNVKERRSIYTPEKLD